LIDMGHNNQSDYDQTRAPTLLSLLPFARTMPSSLTISNASTKVRKKEEITAFY